MLLKFIQLFCICILFACTPEPKNNLVKQGCSMNMPCNYSGGFLISLENEQVTAESPFIIRLSTPHNIKIEKAILEGVNMYMGSIPLFFKSEQKNTWHAEAMVGACSEPEMTWRLTVTYRAEGQTHTLMYFFNSQYE